MRHFATNRGRSHACFTLVLNDMAWSNEDTYKFLELYQKEPDIWDPKSKNYKDRIKVNDAWNRLSDAMDMSIDKLKRRKETLMTAYRFHFKKRLEALRIGADYTPIWTFYKPMESFLNDIYGSKSWSTTEDNASSSSRQDDRDSEEERFEDEASATKPKLKKRRYKTPDQIQQASSEMKNAFKSFAQVLKQYHQQTDQDEEDECELYGQLIAKKLRQCSEMERLEIMYEFDGVLLNRRMNFDTTDYNMYPGHSPHGVEMKHQVSGSSTPSHSPT